MIIYNRNGKYIKWMLVSFVLFIITAILNLIAYLIVSLKDGSGSPPTVWFIIAFFFGLNYYWSRKTPFIKITESELKLNLAIARRQKIQLSEIEGIETNKNKTTYSILTKGKKVKIGINNIQKDQQQNFIEEITKISKK
ncbi:hypothetical protein OAG06_00470 [Verrucomicrobia bacterium]|nr:hypothetical protein [Verrucomicrobiota bacterium]